MKDTRCSAAISRKVLEKSTVMQYNNVEVEE